MQPEYFVSIRCARTEQCVFTGHVRGALAPVLEDVILDNARTMDAGKRLTRGQRKRAYHYER